jgi:hypothetical protein
MVTDVNIGSRHLVDERRGVSTQSENLALGGIKGELPVTGPFNQLIQIPLELRTVLNGIDTCMQFTIIHEEP